MPLKVTQDEQLAVNLTPMIDVVFLLVVFFMVATKFTEVERSIDLQLPTAAEAGDSTPPPQPTIVAVHEGGRLEMNGERVSLAELSGRLAAEASRNSDQQVVIHGDGRCDFQHVAAALAACREGGVSDLSITVEIAAGPTARRR